MSLDTEEQVRKAMLAKIAGSLLDTKDAAKLHFEPLAAAKVKELSLPASLAGFRIPYFTLDGKLSKFWRLRYLEDTRKGFDKLNGRKTLRYVQPGGSVNEVYLPPYVDWQDLAKDVEEPLIITEGELKAACATRQGLPTIGLGGVWSFKSNKQTASLLPALKQFNWKARRVTICFDSDASSNPQVVAAENALARALTDEGAEVYIARLPGLDNGAKVGIDDYLLTNTVDDLVAILTSASEYAVSCALHAMNEQVVYIRDPGLVFDYVNNMRLSCDNFTKHAYATHWHDVQAADGKVAQKQTAKLWLVWPARAELASVTFKPGEPRTTDGKLNLWTGWPIEPKKGDIKPWQFLMTHLFQNTEPEARKWFEQWCAYPLQNPGQKMPSAACFWGKAQGTGKSMVGVTLMRIYGKYSSEITDTEVEDTRREWAENKQFILADDITGNDARKMANKLKTMISQKELKLDKKYVPKYSVPDCINYYFTANGPDCFYMEDDDRRNFIHEVTALPLTQEERNNYADWKDTDEGIAALFHYFLNLDLTGFDPFAPALATNAKRTMIYLTKSDVAAWVADLRNNYEAMLDMPGDLFTAAELLRMYDPIGVGKVSANGMARELTKAGFRAPGKHGTMAVTKFGNMRLYAIRNIDEWRNKPARFIVDHYESTRTMEPLKKKSTVKF